MTDKLVTTPMGKMHVAGPLRSNGAVLLDFLIASECVVIVNEMLERAGIKDPYIYVFAFLLAALYSFLARREKVPGIGRWALGIHRFSYADVAEYDGSGTLIVYEPLANRIYSRRAIVATILLLAPYLVLRALLGR